MLAVMLVYHLYYDLHGYRFKLISIKRFLPLQKLNLYLINEIK